MNPRRSKRKSPSVVRENIEAVAEMEQKFLERRSQVDRFVDGIADFSGSLTFVLLHVVALAFWIAANSGHLRLVPRFDPFPFPLLSTAVSAEAVLLSTFVLMKQNRMSRRAEERDHLHLQINLLAEKEITKILQTLTLMSDHIGMDAAKADPQIQELSQNTAVHDLAEELREKIGNISDQI